MNTTYDGKGSIVLGDDVVVIDAIFGNILNIIEVKLHLFMACVYRNGDRLFRRITHSFKKF